MIAAMWILVSSVQAGELPSGLSPAELVRKTVQNEVAANNDSGAHFMFKDQRKTIHLSQTKLMVETREATAGMLVEQNGEPLSPVQQRGETARLENYLRNPAELAKKRKQEKEDADRSIRIMKAMPDAFLYESDGTAPGTAEVGKIGHELVRLRFHPNPNYNPPSRVEQVLTGMRGIVLIDANETRIAEINGTLEKEVGFGWGILGHLNPGGHFLVRQADVGNGQWEVTQMDLAVSGKILLFKKLDIRSSDIFSDFRPVPRDLTFAGGVELLKKYATNGQPSQGSKAASQNDARMQSNRQTRPSEEAVVDPKASANERICCQP
jgi:hypothetical protein